ncbi:hypothetical protein KC19_1G259600 [Ceratodon purpureus]|uniref:VWFA domain-containing protein n=1 Tax=Ceratodon purpureus TaxID=3225 RepID=A0A8T0J9D5_CERPU|nr:hypothetical protein KC19_1G259600 [Ceratodon purpureus]
MTKMKNLPQYSNGLSLFCLILIHAIIAINVISIGAQNLSADQLLAQKVQELNIVVTAVEGNSRNCSALLRTCSNTGDGCSRLSCYKYGTQDDTNYQCLVVDNNPDCGSECQDRNFDFTKAFVRRVDSLNENIAQTVCTQRTLDATFINNNISTSSHLFRVFLGSVDGTTRIYPGLDENCVDDYDPRLRPWYLESIYVPKAVTVLIDSGNDMRSKIPGFLNNDTYIGKAMNMSLEFLKTLTDVNVNEVSADLVNIACFDGSVYTPLMNSTLPAKYNSSQPFSDSLDAVITNGNINPSATGTAADAGVAITKAISTLKSIDSATHLKVVIVLVSKFLDLSELNISSTNSDVNVFVYNFWPSGGAAQCEQPPIRASSEQIPSDRFDNPLYAMLSYYSFLAKTHTALIGTQNIDFGQQYPDYSGVDNSTLTLSKSAFGDSGEFLGVVGIDFFQKKVEQQYYPMQFNSIVTAAGTNPPITYNSSLIPSLCFNHTDACEGQLNGNNVNGVCEVPVKTGDPRIGCCGECKQKKSNVVPIVGGVVGGVGGLIALVIIAYLVRPCIRRRIEHEKKMAASPKFIFTGPEHETVDQGDTTGNFERRVSPG